MDFNTLNVKGPLRAGVDQLVYKNVLGSDATSVTISGLDGDNDLEYFANVFVINGYNGASAVVAKPNNDGTSANYGHQRFRGTNTTVAADRPSCAGFILSGGLNNLNDKMFAQLAFYAKSGAQRNGAELLAENVSGTTVTSIQMWGSTWTNTANNLTSLVLEATGSNGLKAGSVLELFVRRGVRN